MDFDNSLSAGTLYGLFFLLQSFGYATGARLAPPTKLYLSVLFGVSHLRHIVRPWDKVGMPLGPAVCGAMIILIPWLNELQTDRSGVGGAVLDWYFSIIIVLTMFGPGLADTFGEHIVRVFEWLYDRARLLPIVVHSFYVAGFLVLVYVARVTLGTTWRSIPVASDTVWGIVAVAVCVWLLFMSYGGSRFDGMLDRRLGTVPDELKSPSLLGGSD